MTATTYTTKSNANRAGKKNCAEFTVTGSKAAGYNVCMVCRNAADTAFAAEKGFTADNQYTEEALAELQGYADDAAEEAAQGTTPTEGELDAMDQFGAGTEAAPVCPHCGTNHMDNGYAAYADLVDLGTAGETRREYTCLGCGGEWGPVVGDFATQFECMVAMGKSKCASLRGVAHKWGGTRKTFIAAATKHGIKEATASANWAAMVRGEW